MAAATPCKDAKALFVLKQKAIKYYEENGVPVKMEEILNSMFYANPSDVYGHLVNFFNQFIKPALLDKIIARPVYDSMGMLTIQIDVYCTINNLSKLTNSCTISNADIKVHAAEQEKAALDMHKSVLIAINMINSQVSGQLAGMDPLAQEDIDALVLEFYEGKKRIEMLRKLEEPEKASIQSDEEKKKAPKQSLALLSRTRRHGAHEEIAKGSKHTASIIIVPNIPLEVFAKGCEIGAAISQAVCVCAAKTSNIPIYQHIAQLARFKGALHEFCIPLPMVTVIQTGKNSPGKANCVKEFMIVPGVGMSIDKSVEYIYKIYHYVAKALITKCGPSAMLVTDTGALCPELDTPQQAMDLLIEAVNAQGLMLGQDMHLALNVAAHEFFDYDKGRYELMTGQLRSPDELADFWIDFLLRYPAIMAVIDPIRGEDLGSWLKLCQRISGSVFIIGDRFYQRPGLLKLEELPSPIQTSGIVLHFERLNTVSDIIEINNMFGEANNEIVIAANQADTTDTFLVDLAVGLNARFLKVGGPCRGERSCKLNRLVQILSELEPPEEKSRPTLKEISDQVFAVEAKTSNMLSNFDVDASMGSRTSDAFTAALKKSAIETDFGLWGEDKKCTLKLQSPFVFHIIEPPPTPSLVPLKEEESCSYPRGRDSKTPSKDF